MSETIYYDLKQVSGPVPSLATRMAKELGRRIISGSYQPGELVEDETALARHYHVSRSVVRDAVKILVGKGLLTARRGIGTRVQDRNHWGLLDDDIMAWSQSVPPSANMFRQLMDVRTVFEPRAARWAAERALEADIAAIGDAIQRMELETGAIEDFVVADALFHRSILHAAHNEFLRALEGVIFSALLNSIRLTNTDPRENEASLPLHRKVYEAIRARNGSLAEEVMTTLLSDAHARLGSRIG